MTIIRDCTYAISINKPIYPQDIKKKHRVGRDIWCALVDNVLEKYWETGKKKPNRKTRCVFRRETVCFRGRDIDGPAGSRGRERSSRVPPTCQYRSKVKRRVRIYTYGWQKSIAFPRFVVRARERPRTERRARTVTTKQKRVNYYAHVRRRVYIVPAASIKRAVLLLLFYTFTRVLPGQRLGYTCLTVLLMGDLCALAVYHALRRTSPRALSRGNAFFPP